MPLTTRHHLSERQSGIALVLVLWMLVLLTVIANGLVFSSRSEIQVVNNLAALAKAEALADAGVFKAIQELKSTSLGQLANTLTLQIDPSRWRADGLTRAWQYGGGEIYVTIMDETGKIDLNTAPAPLMLGFLRASGVEEEQALALVDAILDWRDADSLKHPRGAEKEDYAAAGLPYSPANADFESIDELRQVIGMSETLFNRIEPYITVYSYQGGINSAMAPRQVLLALPGATEEQVDSYIAQRTALLEQGQPAPMFPLGQGFAATATAAAYTILVVAVLGDNTKFTRQAVIRLTGAPNEAYVVLDWRAPIAVNRALPTP